jgi:hypothetical protein
LESPLVSPVVVIVFVVINIFVSIPTSLLLPTHPLHTSPPGRDVASPLECIPEEVLQKVIALLKAESVHNLCCTRSTFVSSAVFRAIKVPGLRRLELFPHQLASLQFLLRREKVFAEKNGADGGPSSLPPCAGSLMCDEPGLGKTITVLALVLRTTGKVPRQFATSPPDAKLARAEATFARYDLAAKRQTLNQLRDHEPLNFMLRILEVDVKNYFLYLANALDAGEVSCLFIIKTEIENKVGYNIEQAGEAEINACWKRITTHAMDKADVQDWATKRIEDAFAWLAEEKLVERRQLKRHESHAKVHM